MDILDLGNIEIMSNNNPKISKDFYADFLKDVALIGDGWEVSKYSIASYLIKLSKEYNIQGNILGNYGYTLVSSIDGIMEDMDYRGGASFLIDDPEEIKTFLNGEYAYGLDRDGEEIEISRNSGKIIDWQEEKGIFFVVRKK